MDNPFRQMVEMDLGEIERHWTMRTTQRTPVLLLHGSSGAGRSWKRVVERLEGVAPVAAPDLPGHGSSIPLEAPASERTRVAAVAMLSHLEAMTPPLTLVGHSYGGNVALHLAALAPERLAGLVLLEPVCFRALTLAGASAEFQAAERFFAAYVSVVESGAPDAIAAMVDYWFGKGVFDAMPPPARQHLNRAAAANARDVAASFADRIEAEALRRIACPVRLVAGAASPPVAGRILDALEQLLPDACRETIAGATHAMLDSHPVEVADLIARASGQAPVSAMA
ncbi:alpha/beta fold hydrolase [Minwuia thermotolerans]|nr:alpha/beta hydrolase [Minwuia thermotolerans]